MTGPRLPSLLGEEMLKGIGLLRFLNLLESGMTSGCKALQHSELL